MPGLSVRPAQYTTIGASRQATRSCARPNCRTGVLGCVLQASCHNCELHPPTPLNLRLSGAGPVSNRNYLRRAYMRVHTYLEVSNG